MRSKVPRNKSFKQAVGAGLGLGQGSPSGERRRRRRKSLEEQLVRNTEAVAEGVATLSKSSLGSSRSLASSRSSSKASSRRGSTATIDQVGRGGSLADLAGVGNPAGGRGKGRMRAAASLDLLARSLGPRRRSAS